jgi:hypothetical protein
LLTGWNNVPSHPKRTQDPLLKQYTFREKRARSQRIESRSQNPESRRKARRRKGETEKGGTRTIRRIQNPGARIQETEQENQKAEDKNREPRTRNHENKRRGGPLGPLFYRVKLCVRPVVVEVFSDFRHVGLEGGHVGLEDIDIGLHLQ